MDVSRLCHGRVLYCLNYCSYCCNNIQVLLAVKIGFLLYHLQCKLIPETRVLVG